MSKYEGHGAIINKPEHSGINTNGLSCIIEKWDATIKKYEVHFDKGWVGWYKLSELVIEP